MRLAPVTRTEAHDMIARAHRHNKPPTGYRFAIGLYAEHDLFGVEILVGVVIVGRPVSRHLDDRTTAEVTRLCVVEGAPLGSCSKLYRAAWRAWKEMGGQRILTYTLQRESGASLRGAGWIKDREFDGYDRGWTNREGRVRQSVDTEAKVRWVCHVG
jgi:hypothetical protein